jgi:predicted phage tail protein
VKRAHFVVSAAILSALGCGRGLAPTSPSHEAVNAARVSVSTTSALFDTSTIDFARCLQGRDGAACLAAARLSVHAATGAAATLSGAPQNLITSSMGSSVMLTWTAPASGDAAFSYVIEAGSAPGLADLAVVVTGSTATSFSAAGVGNGVYYVRVRAQNAAGTSAASNESTLVVAGSNPCTSAPGPPAGLTITSSGSTVMLSWGAPGGLCAATSYVLQAGSSSGGSDLANANVGNATSYVATDVGAGTYFVRVRAANAFGLSAGSNEVVLTVGPGTASPSPSPSPGSTRWVGVSPEGMVVQENPQGQCPGEFDLQLDLTVSGGVATGTAMTRLRRVLASSCQDVLGQVATWGLSDLRVGAGTIAFVMGSGGTHRFSGTFTDTRMTGTFVIAHTGSSPSTQTGSFALNRR